MQDCPHIEGSWGRSKETDKVDAFKTIKWLRLQKPMIYCFKLNILWTKLEEEWMTFEGVLVCVGRKRSGFPVIHLSHTREQMYKWCVRTKTTRSPFPTHKLVFIKEGCAMRDACTSCMLSDQRSRDSLGINDDVDMKCKGRCNARARQCWCCLSVDCVITFAVYRKFSKLSLSGPCINQVSNYWWLMTLVLWFYLRWNNYLAVNDCRFNMSSME